MIRKFLNQFPDFPTLGIDSNGIYLSILDLGTNSHDIVAIKKPEIYQDPPMLPATKLFLVPSPANPEWYYFPSLMVNPEGDMLMSFSGSSSLTYVGAYHTWRTSAGSSPGKPILLKNGQGFTLGDLWGDCSFTTIDPLGGSFWTVQEYAKQITLTDPHFISIWGTWISHIIKHP